MQVNTYGDSKTCAGQLQPEKFTPAINNNRADVYQRVCYPWSSHLLLVLNKFVPEKIIHKLNQ
jgi:hypothetical protein